MRLVTVGEVRSKHYLNLISPMLNMESGPWVAGGFARELALSCNVLSCHDIDLWFSSIPQLRSVESMIRGTGRYVAVKASKGASKSTIEYALPYKDAHILQLITHRFAVSAEELVSAFSASCCQFVTDGVSVYATEQGWEDAINKVFRVANHERLTSHFVTKYTSAYGYTLVDDIDIDSLPDGNWYSAEDELEATTI